ncbi:Dienelactone hydrolase [Micromonospora phaseoli]|uniref:Dienelactone hydrolase n=1 Tax=Micromonospora phaseoli TaxID=1144548 RepID=A0A1H7AEE0_9ACTN|nr:alpha/beta fold hydrolase [Micromonospora phaseoli]PZV96427.1 dienelactone hydrolase [Micromonospora phaseoli]GIJ76115.1 hydrolase [Micromonospora phaseoli]SEJ63991.1 Dienelactone hydrolase [Micromonospora phaseoli]
MGVRGSEVTIRAGRAGLLADLLVPAEPVGVVLFAHGSGSSRHSPRNLAVAHQLNRGGLGTVLVDLLTEAEEQVDGVTAELRFDIGLLAVRLAAVVDWLATERPFGAAPIGIFGASTGAAAALVAAAQRPDLVRAVVSRGGRPDLAGAALGQVRAATLLLVGGRDEQVIALNEQALSQLTAPAELRVIPGATHLFGEPGTLGQVAEAADDWFHGHLHAQSARP